MNYSGDEFYDDEVTSPIERPAARRKAHPFRSLRDIRYTACPCGCGSKEICEAQRARVKEANDHIPF